MGIICETNTEGNININFKGNNLCFCPSCGETAGENFKGSGKNQASFFCLKCGNSKTDSSYYLCNKCNSIFCIQCPQKINTNLSSCPSCGESAGESFKGSSNNQTSFYCLKCGNIQSNRNYFLCNKCNSIFCFQCPQKKNNENFPSCPSCGESAGENFKGSGTTEENYYCLKCGKLDGLDDKDLKDSKIKKSFFVCYKCKGIFCYKCPYLKHEIFSKCPSCGEPVGEHFTGSCYIQNMQYSGIDKHTFDCLKCGKRIEDSNYYKCDKCNCLFCPLCVF